MPWGMGYPPSPVPKDHGAWDMVIWLRSSLSSAKRSTTSSRAHVRMYVSLSAHPPIRVKGLLYGLKVYNNRTHKHALSSVRIAFSPAWHCSPTRPPGFYFPESLTRPLFLRVWRGFYSPESLSPHRLAHIVVFFDGFCLGLTNLVTSC